MDGCCPRQHGMVTAARWPGSHGRDAGRIRQLPRDSDSAFPARWACIPANSDFNVPNENHHTRNFLIVEFNDANDQKLSAENREK